MSNIPQAMKLLLRQVIPDVRFMVLVTSIVLLACAILLAMT